MQQKHIGVPQIHIIPFDLGIVFYDVLSIDNSKNFLFAEKFCHRLTSTAIEYNWKVDKLFEIIGDKRGEIPLGIKYLNSDFADQVICKVTLKPNLVCYILSSGVGIFYFVDLDCIAMCNTDEAIAHYSKALVANYQKKITQSTILNKANFPDVCPEIEESMLLFRKICWKFVADGVNHRIVSHVRPFSGNVNYKSNGLSYILTIYIFEANELNEKELNNLLCSSMFGKVVNPDRWEKINSEINATESSEKAYVLDCGAAKVYASWSAVAVVSQRCIQSLDDIRENEAIANLLKVESYVQSRWFIADNSMDNVNKNSKATMESLQRIASLMEFCQAELDNEISANMQTIQKNILKLVVETSAVKQLYKSVLNQIKTQLKIKEAHYQDKKSRNRLIADLFLAIFTASSLYKTILDLVSGSFGWWNWLLFGGVLVVAVGTIIFNYKNR